MADVIHWQRVHQQATLLIGFCGIKFKRLRLFTLAHVEDNTNGRPAQNTVIGHHSLKISPLRQLPIEWASGTSPDTALSDIVILPDFPIRPPGYDTVRFNGNNLDNFGHFHVI